MAEYRYYLIPDFMSHVFPQQFEEQAPTEFFSNTADLMKRYKQLREMPYNNEYTWNERTNLPYPRLTVGIDRRDPDGAVTIMQVRNGINYLCDDYCGPFADRNDKQLIEMAKQLVTAVGVDRIRPHYYTEVNGHTKVHVGKDIHITEWANAPELCSALRFSRFLNRDGQQLSAAIEQRTDKSRCCFLAVIRSAHSRGSGSECVLGGHFQFIKKIHALVCHLKKNSRTHWSKIGFYLHQIAFGWICAVCGSCDGENTSRSARNVDRTVGTVKGIGISHLVHMSDNHNRTACIFRNRYQMIKLGSCFVGIVHRTTFSDIGTHRVKN